MTLNPCLTQDIEKKKRTSVFAHKVKTCLQSFGKSSPRGEVEMEGVNLLGSKLKRGNMGNKYVRAIISH